MNVLFLHPHNAMQRLSKVLVFTSNDDDGVRSVMFAALRSLHDIYTSVLMVFDVTIHCKKLMHAKITSSYYEKTLSNKIDIQWPTLSLDISRY